MYKKILQSVACLGMVTVLALNAETKPIASQNIYKPSITSDNDGYILVDGKPYRIHTCPMELDWNHSNRSRQTKSKTLRINNENPIEGGRSP